MLADTNAQGHFAYLRQLLRAMGLFEILSAVGIELLVFADVGLASDTDDRSLWKWCQQNRLVLFTDNRNEESAISLQSTLRDSWQPGDLPIITLANKTKFEQDPDYRKRVAADVAEILYGIVEGEYRDRARIFVPL
ncbi:MAG: hypothetical protein ACREHD_14205 [Pirellulales bacterium]